MAVKVSKVWPVEKYARFISDPQQTVSLQRDAKKGGGVWQHYSSKEGSIQLALLESNHFMVSSGHQIYESLSLWESRKWMKGVTKGDSILFVYRLRDENRRFRVKFAPMAPQITSLETCRLCITTLSPLVPIREMVATSGMDVVSDSQIPLPREDSQMLMSQSTQQQEETGSQLETTCTSSLVGSSVHIAEDQTKEPLEEDICPNEQNMMSLPDLAKLMQSQGKSLGRVYAETDFPTEQLGSFIRLCLTDGNFPGFVEAVEKEMNHLTGGK